MYVPGNREWLRLDEESRSRLLGDAVREVARRSFSGAFVYFLTIFALLFTSRVWHDYPALTCAALAVTLIAGTGRFLASRQLVRMPAPTRRWILALRISTLACMAGWSAYCGFAIHLYSERWPSTYLLIAGASLSGAATTSLAPDAALGIPALIVIIFPAGLVALMQGTPSSTLLGLSAWMYLAYLIAQLSNSWRNYWKITCAAALDAMLSRRAAMESEIRFRTLFEDAPSGIYVAHRNGRIEMANLALAEMLGYAWSDEIRGRNLNDFSFERDRAEIARQIQSGGYAIGWESDWMRSDGRRIRVRESARVVGAGAEPGELLLGSVEDVSARFAADETRRKLIEILEGTSDFVENIAATGETLYLNRAGRTLIEAEPGTEAQSLWARSGDADLRRARLERADREGIWEGESWLLAPDGKTVAVSQVIIPHRGRDGLTHSFSIISRDISSIRAAEQALRDTQEQLSQSQRLESLGRLAGGIAHDFNNLLTIIMGHSSILSQDTHEERTLEGLSEISRAAQRAADLTKQLLAFGRKQVLSKGIIDVNEIVQRAERMLRRLIGERIELITKLAESDITVSADGAQLEQMIVNLVLNGRDAMPDGGVATIETSTVFLNELSLHASLRGRGEPSADGIISATANREYVSIRVSDTGIGMDEETRARIFEPFFTTKGPGKGTGLGLATAYGFVNQSGGDITVSSTPGVGTTFEVLLPRSWSHAVAEHPDDFAREERGTERILIVDDEPALRSLLRQTLAGYGYRVFAASGGEEAIQLARASADPIDLLVTDVIMPGLTGPQLAKRLKAILPEIGVLFISGYPGETAADREAFGPGASYLSKPFTAETLLRSVRQQLQRRAAPAGAQ